MGCGRCPPRVRSSLRLVGGGRDRGRRAGTPRRRQLRIWSQGPEVAHRPRLLSAGSSLRHYDPLSYTLVLTRAFGVPEGPQLRTLGVLSDGSHSGPEGRWSGPGGSGRLCPRRRPRGRNTIIRSLHPVYGVRCGPCTIRWGAQFPGRWGCTLESGRLSPGEVRGRRGVGGCCPTRGIRD